MRISSPPTTGPCYYGNRHAAAARPIASAQSPEQNPRVHRGPTRSDICPRGDAEAARGKEADPARCTARRAFSGKYPVLDVSRSWRRRRPASSDVSLPPSAGAGAGARAPKPGGLRAAATEKNPPSGST